MQSQRLGRTSFASTSGRNAPGHYAAPGRLGTTRRLIHVAQPAQAGPGLSMLQSTRPIDRMRYQAKLLFDHFDGDKTGRLSAEQVGSYVEYCNERFGAGRKELDALYTPLLVTGNDLPFESFVDLVRAQVKALSANSQFLESHIKAAELGKLLFKCAITSKEMAAAYTVFKLLDFNNDGYLRMDEMEKSQGIEKKIFDDVLRDADTNNDGFLTFEDYLTSYAKERPVFMAMACMVANVGIFWLIMQAPIDIIFKVVLASFLVVKPQLVNNPVIKLYHIVMAIINRFRAAVEVGEGMGGTAGSSA